MTRVFFSFLQSAYYILFHSRNSMKTCIKYYLNFRILNNASLQNDSIKRHTNTIAEHYDYDHFVCIACYSIQYVPIDCLVELNGYS